MKIRTSLAIVLLGILSAGLGRAPAAEPLSFQYADGQPQADTSLRTHRADLAELKGEVYVYASFGPLAANPAELVDDRPKGMQTIAVGHFTGEKFVPAARFGIVRDTHRGLGDYSYLLPWLFDGRFDYYGGFARPRTPYDFRLRMDLDRRRVSCWVVGSGDNAWFPLVEDAPFNQPKSLSLEGQDGWVVMDKAAGVAAEAGAKGSQGVSVSGQCYRAVGPYSGGKVYLSMDVRFKRGGGQFVQLWKGAPYTEAGAARVLQFGFDNWADNLYAHGGAGGSQVQGTGGLPKDGRWVTIWAVLDYGAHVATFGWCNLDERPFVDGKRLSDYAMGPSPVDHLLFLGREQDRFDNVYVGDSPSPPDAPTGKHVAIDFEAPRYRAGTSISAIDAIRVEQAPGAPGIRDLEIRSTPRPEREAIQAHPLAKKERVVGLGKGFRFQSMRSLWRKPGRQVTVARTNPKTAPAATAWLGFPDVVQTGSTTLVCVYTTGGAHGGGGTASVRHSNDLGKTWGEPIVVHAAGTNTPRLQKLEDGSLLVLLDIHGSGDVPFYQSTDGGHTWKNIGRLSTKQVGGHPTPAASCPSRVTELPDGSWLVVASWLPAQGAFACTEGMQLDVFRSTDRGQTWELRSAIKEHPRAICEASIVVMPTGRMWLFAREAHRRMPGVKTYSDDQGKTWAPLEEMPFPVVGRTCAELLKDGRVMLTHRALVGRAALWAWTGDPEEKTQAGIVGAHYNDARSVGLKDDQLHIDNNGSLGQFTRYRLRGPDGPESLVDVTAELKVLSNSGSAATLGVPYVGELRFFPDRVELKHDPSLTVEVTPGQFHTYRVVGQQGQMTLYIDGQQVLTSDKADKRVVATDWSPIRSSPYPLAFGNEPLFITTFEYSAERMRNTLDEWDKGYQEPVAQKSEPAAFPSFMMLGLGVSSDRITPRVTGHSIWRRVEVRLEDPQTGPRTQSWVAKRDGFPDQYQLDRVLEVEASVGGGDQGYSGWTQLDDGRIFVVNYTDDTAPACLNTLKWPTGLPWIRGTYVLPSDLNALAPGKAAE